MQDHDAGKDLEAVGRAVGEGGVINVGHHVSWVVAHMGVSAGIVAISVKFVNALVIPLRLSKKEIHILLTLC